MSEYDFDALSKLEIFRRRHPELVEVPARELTGDVDQLAGVGVGKRFERHRVDDAEDGARRADAERDGDDRRRRERRAIGASSRAPCRRSRRPFSIIMPGRSSRTSSLTRSMPPTSSIAARRASSAGIPAFTFSAIDELDIAPHLGVEIALDVLVPEQIADR